MPAYTSGQPVEREIDLVIYIGNDTDVDLTVDSGVYVTVQQLEEALKDAGGGLVVIEQGQDIPIAERKDGFLYFKVADVQALSVTPEIAVIFDE